MKSGRLPSPFLALAVCVGAAACFDDNPPAYQDILGPEREPPAGDTGEAGEASSGASMGGAGNAPASGGSGNNPPIDPNFSPPCFLGPTVNGEEILKGTPCTPEDPQLCYRPCGPNQVGWKTETCLAGVYAEGDCTFPADEDYTCYAIPQVIDASACALEAPPAATAECTAPACLTCNFEGFYQDTGSDVKEGYCVCREPDPEGIRRWTCASVTAWPCPLNRGC
jgi:hypothetical protein